MQLVDIEKLKKLGLNLMPLQEESKEPVGGSWKHLQTEMYKGDFPDSCNVAVICGETSQGLFVVDLDHESLYKEFEDYETYTTKTGKGNHIYFRSEGFLPENRKLNDYRFRHVDIKSQGGYVLAEGSIHPDTKKPYEVIKDIPIMKINPQEILDKLEKIGFTIAKKSIKEIKNGVEAGGRNDETFKYACYLVREGVIEEALRKEVEEMNSKNKPPLPQYEIDIILKQATNYEQKNLPKSEFAISMDGLKEKIESFEPNSKVNISSDLSEYTKVLGKDTILDVIKNTRDDIIVEIYNHIMLHDINPTDHEGVIVEFDAQINALGQRQTYNKSADFFCPDCGDKRNVACNVYREIPIPFCVKCKKKYGIELESRETAFIQQMKIQEFLEDAYHNSPVEYDAEIHDENVGQAFMGDRVRFVGKFRSIPPKGKTDYNLIVFDILEMKQLDQQVGCMPEPEEIQKWKDTPNMFTRLTNSIIPDLLMKREIIESTILYMSGGTAINGKRNIINEALVGDAQLGKSELSRRVHKIILGSGYTEGRKTTGAGLTIGMVKMYDGTMVPKAGLLPQHTGYPVIIDEGDKLKQEDQDSILECMEQGQATLTKAGYAGLTLPTVCEILFACNPKGGKFSTKKKSIMDNFNMSVPFISRFDIIWLMKDLNDADVDDKTRKHIRYYKEDDYMKLDELQRYFTYVRSLNATIPENLRDKIDELHKSIRPLNKVIDGLPIGWRQYHGIYRLVTACATAHLRTVATEEDFDIVNNIIHESYATFDMNIDEGTADTKFNKTEKKMSKSKLFEEVWKLCEDENGEVSRAEVISELKKTDRFSVVEAGTEWNRYQTMGSISLNNDTERWYMENG